MRDKRGRLSRLWKKSEVELGAKLSNAWIPRLGDHAHLAIQVAVWVLELRMVEEVKEFGSNLKRHRFGNLGLLHQTDVEVVDPRPVEELPIGGAELSQLSWSECICIEEGIP